MSKLGYNCVALLNGKVITVDGQDRMAEAVLVVSDRIASVGTNEEIRQMLPKGCQEIDLGGRAVIPGFVDSHVHTELTVNSFENAANVQTPPHENLEQMFNEIKRKVESTPKGEWIIARASNDFFNKISDKRLPTREELDRIAPDHPVLFNMEVHFTILNTFAIETLGWTQETWMPKNSTLGRDPNTGELTGYYTEGWWDDFKLTPWGYDRLLEALRIGTMKHFVSNGVTSIHELPYTIDGIKAWQQLKRQDELPLRVRMYLQHPNLINLDEFLRYGLQEGFGDEWLSIGGIKFFVDGIGLHANMHPVEDLKFSQDELNELIFKAHIANLPVWAHVATETGLDVGINAIQYALNRLPKADHRMRLEHAGERLSQYSTGEKQLERMRELGIVPIVTPQFTHSLPDFVSPTLRKYIDKGFILPGNSDATGSQREASNPWHGIWVAVTGKNFYGNVKYPEECLTPLEAIRMFTLWGAWGGFEEKIKGSIEPGKLADIVVLGTNPLTCDPDALKDMTVDLVMIGGKVKTAGKSFQGLEDHKGATVLKQLN